MSDNAYAPVTADGAEFVRLNATHGERKIRLDRIVSMREVG